MSNKIKSMFISFVVLAMSLSIGTPLNGVFAQEEAKDEKFVAEDFLKDDEEVTTMDEEGNVYLLEDVEKNMSENNKVKKIQDRSNERITNSSTAVVNFRIYSSATTNTSYSEEGTNREGYTNGYYAADGAFLGYDNESKPTKVKFMQAGVVGWVDINKVEVLNYTDAKVNTLSKYYVKNGKLYHGISTNLSNSNYSSSLEAGAAPSYLKEGYDYYSYDGHYFYEGSNASSYARMLSDYRNNRRTNAINGSSPYYNYYLYLSHRSTTTYTAKELNDAIASLVGTSEKSYGRTSKLRNLGDSFISNQNKYGTNALLMLAVAANESAWGCSNIAAQKNNLFGHAAYDSDPNGSANGYSSVEYSIYYHAANFVSKGYLDPVTDSRYYGANLGDKASGMNVKYASDPYWGEKAAAVCWRIDNYLGTKDASKYTIAIKDTLNTNHSIINIKSDANSNSNTLYSTYPISSKSTYSTYAPSNYAFIVLKNGDKNNYYKIQSDGAVNSNRTGIIQNPSQSEYNFDTDYGYIPKSSVTVVCEGNNSTSSTNDQNTENVTGKPTGKDINEPTLYYSANSQNVGWLDEVNEPNTAGTTGRSLQLYQIKINLKNAVKSAVLSGRVYSNGSWLNYNNITASTIIGNSNSALQLVNFTLKNQSGYKLQYRVHSEDIGWQPWVDQENNAGTSGKNIQAIDFRLVKDNSVVVNKPDIIYSTHIQDIGWQSSKSNGQTSGGINGKKIEAIKIFLDNNEINNGSIQYQSHVQDYGWQNWVNEGGLSGTEGLSKRIEAIRIKLTGQMANIYNVYYRVYVEKLGWLDWAKNGDSAGTSGYSYRIESIEIKLVQNNESAPGNTNTPYIQRYIGYTSHVEDYGWQSKVYDGAMSGTTGKTKQLEAIKITLESQKYSGNIEYRSHIEDYGWENDWKSNGQISGTSGRAKQLEAIQIRLTGEMSIQYDIYYRVHVENLGWLDWAKNGEKAGTAGYAYRIEAMEIKLVEKGEEAPGSMQRPYTQKYYIGYSGHVEDYGWQKKVYDGELSGTSGKAKQLEAIKITLENPGYEGSVEYRSHIEDYGWESDWKANGELSGTVGRAKQLEAIQIRLTDEMSKQYDIYYQVCIEENGWLGWARNGEKAGSEGFSKRIEAIKIELVEKGGKAPGNMINSFIKK